MRQQYKNRWSRDELAQVLREHDTHAKAAAHLGIGRSTLTKILALYQLKTLRADYRKHGNDAWKALAG